MIEKQITIFVLFNSVFYTPLIYYIIESLRREK